MLLQARQHRGFEYGGELPAHRLEIVGRVARKLGQQLPELADVADVMQLDETGAALSGALRARVRELRGAHLTQEQIAASAEAEGMTLYMALPALIFGLIFLVAALLKILSG